MNMICTAIGGEHSETGAARFEEQVLCHRPDVLLIDYALNDRGIGLERAHAAWSQMIEQAIAKDVKVILLTPTWDKTQLPDADAREQQELIAHAEQVRSLAEHFGVGFELQRFFVICWSFDDGNDSNVSLDDAFFFILCYFPFLRSFFLLFFLCCYY